MRARKLKLFADFLSNSKNFVRRDATKFMAPTMLLVPSCITKGTSYFFHTTNRRSAPVENFHGKEMLSPIIASLDRPLDFYRSIVRSVRLLCSSDKFRWRIVRSLDLFCYSNTWFSDEKCYRERNNTYLRCLRVFLTMQSSFWSGATSNSFRDHKDSRTRVRFLSLCFVAEDVPLLLVLRYDRG